MSEHKILLEGIKRYGKRAYMEARRKNIPTTILRGNSVCRISQGGETEILSTSSQTRFKVTQRKYKL